MFALAQLLELLLLLLAASPLKISIRVSSCRTVPPRTVTAPSFVIPVATPSLLCAPVSIVRCALQTS